VVCWFGASQHMRSNQKCFTKFQNIDPIQRLYLGENSSYPIHNQRTIQIVLPTREEKSIEDVLFVLGLKKILISISASTNVRFTFIFAPLDLFCYRH
jgi:hypothetical protein